MTVNYLLKLIFIKKIDISKGCICPMAVIFIQLNIHYNKV